MALSDHPTLTLFFRKPWPGGNFSIEASFRQMMAVFPADSRFRLRAHIVKRHSKGLWPRLRILWEAWRQKTAINHITGDIHFIALVLPGRRTILTIHDCGFMQHPRPLVRGLLWLFWLYLPVRRVGWITAVSEATKQEVLRYTGCSPDKIRVIPTVIRNHFEYLPKPFSAEPVVLHIGTAPNKNLARHIEALAGLPVRLHIIGRISDPHRRLLDLHGIRYRNDWNLSDAEVKAAYVSCDLLLFASTLEGFGMPILEAQSVGRPVITSHCSSMPEVAGSGACLVNPLEVADIRAGVLRVLEDARYRENLIAAGLDNVKRFRAEAVAAAYQRLYEEVAVGGG
ncbi:MAG: glycosyltransferase family 4 protein [Saprospiraceae bacterium]|nr:glycosyltransferase family 4 protein [Saprospiraceae bacterium]